MTLTKIPLKLDNTLSTAIYGLQYDAVCSNSSQNFYTSCLTCQQLHLELSLDLQYH